MGNVPSRQTDPMQRTAAMQDDRGVAVALSVAEPFLRIRDIGSVAHKSREAGGAAGPRKEFRKAVAQRLRGHHFRGRGAGADRAQPGTEMPPYQAGMRDGEVLQEAL